MFTLPRTEAQLRVYISDLQRQWERVVTGDITVTSQDAEESRLMGLIKDAVRALRKLLRHMNPGLNSDQLGEAMATACGR